MSKFSFVQVLTYCDRYANTKYSIDTNSRMAKVYKKEMMEFLNKLGNDKYLSKELCEMMLNL